MVEEIKNSKEVNDWLWNHAQIMGHKCDATKNEAGINVKWVDTVTGEDIGINYNHPHRHNKGEEDELLFRNYVWSAYDIISYNSTVCR